MNNSFKVKEINAYKTIELSQRPDLPRDDYLDKPLNSQKEETAKFGAMLNVGLAMKQYQKQNNQDNAYV